jgi:hypothetical protein
MNHIYSSLIKLPESSRALPVLLSFAGLLMGALYVVRLNADLNYDGEIYIAAAMKFADGMFREGLSIYPMPAYPFLIALIHTMLPDWVLAGRLISLISMTLLVIPLYLLAKGLFSRRAAFWSCIVFILLPESLAHSNSVLRDPSFFLFFTLATYFAQEAMQSNQFKHMLFCSIFGVLSTFFRVEGLLLFPVFFCFLIGAAVVNTRESKRYIILAFSWGVMCVILVAASLVTVMISGVEILNRYVELIFYYQRFIDLNFLESYHRIADQLQQISDSSAHRGIGQHVAETAKTFLPLLYMLSILQLLSATMLVPNLIPLGLGLAQTDYNIRQLLVLALTAGILLLAYAFFIRTEIMLKRYILMPSILLCPWIGFGIDKILNIVQKMPSPWSGTACIVLVVFLFPVTEFDKYFLNKDDLATRAGAWISRSPEFSNLKVVYNDQIVKFYADTGKGRKSNTNSLLHLDPTDTDFSKLFQFTMANKVDAIVIRGRGAGKAFSGEFPGYREIMKFSGGQKFVKVFLSENT